nr:RHS domain-containing protein [Paludibacteraceae bacterium]
AYNSASQLTQKVYANGITTDYTYNANGWIESISAAKSVLSLKTTYDAVGNITKRADLLDDSRTENYTYDAIGQILSQTRGSSKTEWQYDLLGNRVKELKNGVATNYTANNINAYTAVSGAINVTPTYDGNGNLLTDGSHTYQYDLSNRLSSADNKAATYAYDALGRRISKATADGTLTYCYVGNQMVEEYKDGTLSRQWLYGDDIDDAVMMQVGNDSYWYHTNHLGSPMCLTDSKGNIVERYEYDAFGAPSFFDAQGNTLSQSKVGNTILFTGREYDYETETYYFRARQQHPLLGRFMQHDPLMYIDGMNDYAYVGNMTIVYVDITATLRVNNISSLGKMFPSNTGRGAGGFSGGRNNWGNRGGNRGGNTGGGRTGGTTGSIFGNGFPPAHAGDCDVTNSPNNNSLNGEDIGDLLGGLIGGALVNGLAAGASAAAAGAIGGAIGGPVGAALGGLVGFGVGFAIGTAGSMAGSAVGRAIGRSFDH